MPKGVCPAKQKNGTVYFRSGIHYHSKHISLGSYPTEAAATAAYLEASDILNRHSMEIYDIPSYAGALSFEKAVVLINFRDHELYFKNPIYLRKGYFSYFLSPSDELKFDIDDLFYYSVRKIQKRQGHLFVNDYGMQYSILARYGIKPYAVAGRDYEFANGDPSDFRYSNLMIRNHFHGVQAFHQHGVTAYKTVIHINGNYQIGIYPSEDYAAIAYNKAADLAKAAGIRKNFPENYVGAFSAKEYADIYTGIALSKKYLDYLEEIKQNGGLLNVTDLPQSSEGYLLQDIQHIK